MESIKEEELQQKYPLVYKEIFQYLPNYRKANNQIEIEKLLENEVNYSVFLAPIMNKDKYIPAYTFRGEAIGVYEGSVIGETQEYSYRKARVMAINMALKHFEEKLMVFSLKDKSM